MNIDDLYQRVTEAILRAERLEASGPAAEAEKAYLAVSLLEEEIAAAIPAAEEEGEIARRGAVRAAFTARSPTRARALAAQYTADRAASAELIEELREMVSAADADLAKALRADGAALPGAPGRLSEEAA